MEVIKVSVYRFFGVARKEYRGVGKFTLFGFDSDAGHFLEARIDGHPDLIPGEYVFCITGSSTKFDILAYSHPNEPTCIVESSATALAAAVLAAVVSIFILSNVLQHDFSAALHAGTIFKMAGIFPVAALIWLAYRLAMRAIAGRRLGTYLSRNR